jgi:4-hydroxythreonine-4-phosphate dehydrogenase
MSIPRIALTPGEPAGIGPDICLQICLLAWPCQLILIADIQLLTRRSKQLNLDIEFKDFNPNSTPTIHAPGIVHVHSVQLSTTEQCGKLDTQNSRYVLNTLETAAQFCLEDVCSAVVTAPVQKNIINEAGFSFTGHTEFLADYCHAFPVMMLLTDKLKVALVTTHIPLSDVSNTITPDLLTNVINIINNDLKSKFFIKQPRIAVCGLNPHAGEAGQLGQEELLTIIPTLNDLRKTGISLTGPLPADTIFTPKILQQHDVVLGMYHDQVLPTLKYSGFGDAINLTLGLPIIRTSVDHGTALDLAGTGKADSNSLKAAITLAIDLATKK